QRGHELSSRHDGVDAVVRIGRVPALTLHDEPEAVGRGHGRALADGHGAHPVVAGEVEAYDVVDVDPVEGAVVQHDPGAAHDLLGRLEHEDDGAGQVGLAGHEGLGHAQ